MEYGDDARIERYRMSSMGDRAYSDIVGRLAGDTTLLRFNQGYPDDITIQPGRWGSAVCQCFSI